MRPAVRRCASASLASRLHSHASWACPSSNPSPALTALACFHRPIFQAGLRTDPAGLALPLLVAAAFVWCPFPTGSPCGRLCSLRISWDLPPDPYSQKGTVMTWVMRENNGKTWLTFTQSGFDADQDVSGLFTGWRNFVNWVRSVSEYGAAWQPPISVLKPDAMGYPASMYSAQDQIVEE